MFKSLDNNLIQKGKILISLIFPFCTTFFLQYNENQRIKEADQILLSAGESIEYARQYIQQ